jgi:hypothetical protein
MEIQHKRQQQLEMHSRSTSKEIFTAVNYLMRTAAKEYE